MANIASSKKDARRSAKRAAANRSVRSAVKTRLVKARRSLAEGDSESAQQMAREALAGLDRAVSKGILHSNNAARRKSRLMKRLHAAEARPAAPPAKPAGQPKGSRAAKAAAKAPAKAASQPKKRAAAAKKA